MTKHYAGFLEINLSAGIKLVPPLCLLYTSWKNAFNQVGIVPEEVYHGINYNSEKHNHDEMVRYINALGNTAVKMKLRSAEYYITNILAN